MAGLPAGCAAAASSQVGGEAGAAATSRADSRCQLAGVACFLVASITGQRRRASRHCEASASVATLQVPLGRASALPSGGETAGGTARTAGATSIASGCHTELAHPNHKPPCTQPVGLTRAAAAANHLQANAPAVAGVLPPLRSRQPYRAAQQWLPPPRSSSPRRSPQARRTDHPAPQQHAHRAPLASLFLHHHQASSSARTVGHRALPRATPGLPPARCRRPRHQTAKGHQLAVAQCGGCCAVPARRPRRLWAQEAPRQRGRPVWR